MAITFPTMAEYFVLSLDGTAVKYTAETWFKLKKKRRPWGQACCVGLLASRMHCIAMCIVSQ